MAAFRLTKVARTNASPVFPQAVERPATVLKKSCNLLLTAVIAKYDQTIMLVENCHDKVFSAFTFYLSGTHEQRQNTTNVSWNKLNFVDIVVICT